MSAPAGGDGGAGPVAGDLGGPVLGVETSCDETSVAVVEGGRILGHVIATQDEHREYGGVVPEIAARAHLRQLEPVARAALEEAETGPEELAGVGVTAGPGLVGALLVGVSWAKALAFSRGLPLVGVHHMEAHLFAASLAEERARPPFVALLVSGGHTLLVHAREWGDYRILGRTRDDAAGEAFDKVARRLGLGYPGGPEIERVAAGGEAGRFSLPRPMLSPEDGPGDPNYLDFSFAGLKTAAALAARDAEGDPDAGEDLETVRPDLAAEFQAAVVETLVRKTLRAVELTGCRRVLAGGGVACNGLLRRELAAALEGELFVPPPRLAVDNGAMVARAAEFRLGRGERSGPDLNADPNLPFPGVSGRGGTSSGDGAEAGEEGAGPAGGAGARGAGGGEGGAARSAGAAAGGAPAGGRSG